VYRPAGTRFEPEYLDIQDKSGRFSVNCFAWLSAYGLGDIIRISSNFNSSNYLEMLKNEVFPKIKATFHDEIPIFMQDNSPVHTAKIIKEYLNNQEDIGLIDWPVKGADLNPVENLWSYLQFGVSKLIRQNGKPKNSDDLWDYIELIWDLLKRTSYHVNLYQSMPKRVSAVCLKKGGWSKY